MYNQIAANKRRTAVLMGGFVLLVLLFGYGFGLYTGDVAGGLLLAGIFSLGMSWVGYYKSDAIALSTSGAHLIEKSDDPELWNLIENLSITAGIPMPRVAVISDSALNAFATGRDPEHAVVAVTTGLRARLNRAELEGVLAHELSHIQNFDIRLMTVVVVLLGTIALLADLLYWGGGRRDQREGNGALAILGIVLILLAPFIGQLIKFAVSRQREYLADASGALLTRYPEGLASALEKISADPQPLKRASQATAHLFISNPFKGQGMAQLFSTHPPVAQRIARLRSML